MDKNTSVAKMVTAMGMATAVMLLVIPLSPTGSETKGQHWSRMYTISDDILPRGECPSILLHQLLERLDEGQVRLEHPTKMKHEDVVRRSLAVLVGIHKRQTYSLRITSKGLVRAAPATPAVTDLMAERVNTACLS